MLFGQMEIQAALRYTEFDINASFEASTCWSIASHATSRVPQAGRIRGRSRIVKGDLLPVLPVLPGISGGNGIA